MVRETASAPPPEPEPPPESARAPAAEADVARVFREEYGRAVAGLTRVAVQGPD